MVAFLRLKGRSSCLHMAYCNVHETRRFPERECRRQRVGETDGRNALVDHAIMQCCTFVQFVLTVKRTDTRHYSPIQLDLPHGLCSDVCPILIRWSPEAPPRPGVNGNGLCGASIIGLCNGIPPLAFDACETTRPLMLPADDGVYPFLLLA
jgi:hypothetical protein